MVPTRRKTIFILALALSVVAAFIALVADGELLHRLGDRFWFVAMIVAASVAVALSGYVFDLSVQRRLKALRANTATPFAPGEKTSEVHPDEIIGLARNIERMARTLQKVEASYRGIVEDQADLICRFQPDGKLTFANSAYEQAFGQKRAQLVGAPFPFCDAMPPGKRGSFVFERELAFVGGRRALFRWTMRTIEDAQGNALEFQAIGRDVTREKEAEAVLVRAKEAAEAADRAKSEFLAVVSHEIRTPINGVLGFAKMLEDSPLAAEQREHLAMIQTSGMALEKLIGDILDFSRIEAGQIEIEHSAFALHRCVEDVCANFAPETRAAGLTVNVSIDPGVPAIVNGDGARLRQVLTALVGNALKFTPRGEVRVAVTSEIGPLLGDGIHYGLRVFFAVTDTGIGIPAEKMPDLFKPFMQVDASSKRRHGGTGLGLAISKRLCALMGGELTVESRLGEGSTFRFSIAADFDKQDTPPIFLAAGLPLPTPLASG